MIQADIENFVYFAEEALIDVAVCVFFGELLYRCDDIVLVATVTPARCRKVKRERLVGGFRKCWLLSASSSFERSRSATNSYQVSHGRVQVAYGTGRVQR